MKLNPFKKEDKKKEADKAEVSVPEKKETILVSDSGAYKVLTSLYISEKASLLTNINQYVFKVTAVATKSEIAKKVEKLFSVKVKKVKIVKLPAKRRTVGKYQGKTNAVKKAIVVLKPGYAIEQAKA